MGTSAPKARSSAMRSFFISVRDVDASGESAKDCIVGALVDLVGAIAENPRLDRAGGMGANGGVGQAGESGDGDASRWPGHVHVVEAFAGDKGGLGVDRGEPPSGERRGSARAVVDRAL